MKRRKGLMEKEAKKRSNNQDSLTGARNVKVVKLTPASTDPASSSPNTVSVQSSPYFDRPIAVAAKHGRSFFDVPCINLAQNLLGQYVVRSIGSQKIKGKIVETEAYIGPEDKAAHSYKGKKTARNEAMFMRPGTSYVYNIYGMYCCLNISSRGDGSAVLIRALEPTIGHSLMAEGRRNKSADKNKKPLKDKGLTNGPSKLCQALHITKSDFDQVDLTVSDALWVESGEAVDDSSIVRCPRINIGYADDWKEKPLRFYILGNSCVSVRDKQVEKTLNADVLDTNGKAKT